MITIFKFFSLKVVSIVLFFFISVNVLNSNSSSEEFPFVFLYMMVISVILFLTTLFADLYVSQKKLSDGRKIAVQLVIYLGIGLILGVWINTYFIAGSSVFIGIIGSVSLWCIQALLSVFINFLSKLKIA
ncbi:hypothetical protein C4B60_17735 [Jeotgalibacillus proteolyticus]|uniref:SSD domain-containing protein n=1 Tax=Jeotgalibacillus proteolyticus TaxID=2082395 RepID=A0A2S5G846_9BACL|nr:hypothetical protein C4B60_17735 [Jeotgalibacillus proteolyticus]